MYKFSNAEHTAVDNLATKQRGIHPGVYLWEDYLKFVAAGGATEPFDARTLETAATAVREEAAHTIRQQYAALLRDLVRPYLEEERASHLAQEAEALQWQADNAAPCVLIRNMAANRGIPVGIMVEKILENAALYRAECGRLLGLQQKELDELYNNEV
jgi:hypothetical protein